MKINKLIICAAAFLMTFGSAFAQQVSKSDDRYEFQPRWYVQFQDGLTYTFGEAPDPGKLMSNIFQLGGGYDFNPYFGLRANFGYAQNRGYIDAPHFRGYGANIAQLQADATLNLTNLLLGYRHNWAVNVYPFVGFVGNLGTDNNSASFFVPDAWEPTKFFPAGHAGVHFDFKITNHVSATLEGNYFITKDEFNSKFEGRPDKQINVLAGLKYKMGKGFTVSQAYLAAQAAAREAAIAAEKAAAEKAAAEAEAARLAAEKAAAEKAAAEAEAARIAAEKAAAEAAAAKYKQDCVEHSCNIFFALDRSVVRQQEMGKVDDLVKFMNEYPDYKVGLCGYADRGTGTPRYNLPLSERRVKAVKKILMERGIAEERIITDFKGDTVQPFEIPEQNRVVMCLVH
ncbi:MAG: OmpA family protein [Bacteroidales bacterium]|nr:OmpA family protein [Bacteroidales bacterium]